MAHNYRMTSTSLGCSVGSQSYRPAALVPPHESASALHPRPGEKYLVGGIGYVPFLRTMRFPFASVVGADSSCLFRAWQDLLEWTLRWISSLQWLWLAHSPGQEKNARGFVTRVRRAAVPTGTCHEAD